MNTESDPPMAKAKKEEPKEGEEKPAEAAAPAADGAPAAEGAEGAAPIEEGGGGKKKLIMIIGGVVVLLIAVGAGLYFTGMLNSVLGKKADATAEGAKDANGKAVELDKDGKPVKAEAAFVEIPTMIVNLNSDDGTPRYLRLTVQLELEKASDKDAVQAIIPKVIDQFQTYLRELRVRDLRGSGGIYRLQMELLWRVNQAAAPIQVKNVLFQEILIQ